MSKRIEALKNIIEITPEVCVERGRLITSSYQETRGMPIIIRRAKALEKILANMTIYIQRNELIVGNQASKLRAAPLFPEFGIDFIRDELDEFPQRPYDKFIITEENRREIDEIINCWKGRTHCDRVRSLYEMLIPQEVRAAWDPIRFEINEIIKSRSHADTGDGHTTPNYSRVLSKGFNGIIEDIQAHLSTLNPENSQDLEKMMFLKAGIIVCQSATKFAERYSRLAEDLATAEKNLADKAELKKIAEICKSVPANPANTFQEALQSLFFAHLIVQIESNGHAIGLGRVDQYLYPYYQRDIKEGRTTREQALELIECFFIKSCELNKLRPWSYTRFMSGYPMFQDIILGGQTSNGEDATNELTYLFLDATAELRLHQPTTIVRVHKGTPEELLVRACEALDRHGNLPAFFNDGVVIPALLSVFARGGINMSLEDARNYVIVGCGEAIIEGKSIPVSGGATSINLLKIFELTLNNGMNPSTGITLCPGDGNLTDFTSVNDVLKAYERQLAFYLKLCPLLDNVSAMTYAQLTPTPFLSCLIDYRIEIGKDVTEGTGPNYSASHILTHGGPINIGNSLAAIQKLCFEQKTISSGELYHALSSNFEGEEEKIRQILINRAPKYGNDDDYVDLFVKEVLDMVYHELTKHKTIRGVYAPCTQSISANVPFGEYVGATPDGRKAMEPLADNVSPHPGTDTNGPTAVVKSAAKINHEYYVHANILNMKFHPLTIRGENGYRNLAILIKTYFDLGGFQVQFNIVSPEKLQEAQKYPERNRDLIIKVAGYSAQFVLLDKKLQDQIINRTEHAFK